MHNHSHSHNHTHGKSNLFFTVILNVIITIAQLIGGIFSNSLALISDALHNFSDSVALFISYLAERMSHKEADEKKTFGYKRIEIISALFNSFVLIAVCIFLFYEAVKRFFHPELVDAKLVIIVAIIGLIANLLSVLILKKDKDESLNIKSAYLHLLTDTFTSAGVIIGGVLISYYNFLWIDPLITILIGFYVLRESSSVLIQTVNILMQSVPKGIDINKIKKEINNFEEVNNIHHVHIWSLDDHSIHFECHIDVKNDLKISEIDAIRDKIEKHLIENFNIKHTTIQAEYKCSHEEDENC
jgi:cobalt-zinc-cadmium efflux system protein